MEDEQYLLIRGEIFWEDSHNANNTRPDKAVVKLSEGETVVQELTVRPDISGKWEYEFRKVPLYEGTGGTAKKLQYTLTQETVNGYSWSSAFVSQETVDDTLELTTRITDVLKNKPSSSGDSDPDDDSGANSDKNRDSSGSSDSSVSNKSGSSQNSITIGGNGSGSTISGSSGSTTSSGSTASSGSNSTASPGSVGRSTTSGEAGKVKTGDDTPIGPLVGVMAVSLAVIVLLFFFLRRRRHGGR